jgi:UDP-glucose 4-epimerase
MSYLVTGGAGFIGSSLVRRLVEVGHSVRVLDNFATGSVQNISDVLDKVDLIVGDVRNATVVDRAMEGAKHVLHLAALPSVVRSVSYPVLTSEVNVLGTLNTLEAARGAGVETFVLASSSSVYGNTPTLPKTEEMSLAPLSPYAVQKLACEHYCRVYHQLFGLRTFVLRYFNVYGPRQNICSQYAAVIPIFIEKLLNYQSLVIHGDGEQTRDFTFVDDVVEATIRCCEVPNAKCGTYNIACGSQVSVNQLAGKLIDLMDSSIKPIHDDPRKGDVLHMQADVSKACEYLNWQSRISFDEGLRLTLKWFAGEGGKK